MKQFAVCSLLWLCSFEIAEASHTYRVVNVESDDPSAQLERTVLTVQAGADSLNRFDVIRVHQHGLAHLGDQPVILLAPFAFPAEFWEVSTGDYEDGFAAQVALAGYDVWLVDSRQANAAPGQCESGAVDCSAMAGWDQETAIDDAMFVRSLAHAVHPAKKPVIGGFSGGSSTAIASVDHHPQAFAGLVMWEGTLYTEDPAIRARNAAFCAQDEALLASGSFFDPAVQGFKVLFQLAAAAPNDPSPIPLFPPGTTNLQALLLAFSQPDPTNPLNFTDGFVRLVAAPFATTLTYSDVERVLVWGPLVANYAPIAFIRDTHCAIGGSDTRFTDRLDKFKGPVLVQAAGLGFGQMMLDTAALMTKADVTVAFHPELGESDIYFNQDWQTVALAPLVNWLAQVH